MPYVNKEKAREYARKWAKQWRSKNREKNLLNIKSAYQKVREDPIKLEKWRAMRRKYYQKNKDRIIEYGQELRFGGNRKKVFDRDMNKCQICFVKKKEKNLLIHHIDGNGRGSKKPNNNIENLILLCQSCHSIVHKFNKVKDNPIFIKLTNNL